ncbi:MAG: AtpZ/AtpI family protein [Alphaproteobacteria bacterium]|uniref:AtpZ/AtpI family protein n=1 Tax=Candidatus Nitrobium versatile TaxID=2884831 RepID=A0A953LYW4_9BACT|nr:AtpZ/AtpI family protein [Candidatus Nitrobium versatile]
MARKKEEKSVLIQLFELSGIGIQLVLSTFVGLAMGYWLDRLMGTSPYLSLLFLILGIISGFVNMVRLARRAERDKDGSTNQEGR